MAVRYKDLATVELGRRHSRVFYKKTRLNIGGGGDDEAGMDVSIVFEMVSRPQQSNEFTSEAFNSSLILLNPAWFTGSLIFSFEGQFANKSLVNDYTVTIQNKDTLAVIGTIVVPANTAPGASESVWLAAVAPFIPPAGDVKYQMVPPITVEDNALQVMRLRVRVVGRMITGMFQVPMLGIGGGINEQDLTFGDSRFVLAGDTGYLPETASGVFFKQAGAWFTIDHWRWETVSGNTGFLGVSQNFIALCPIGTTNVVVENLHLTTFGVTDLISTDFPDNAGFFVDNGEFVVVSRETATAASNDKFLKANLYVHVTALSKASAYFTVNPATRIPIAAADFSDVAGAAYELAGQETAPGVHTCQLMTSLDPSTSGVEAAVAGSQIDPNMAAKTRYRVTLPANPAGNVYYNSQHVGAGLDIDFDFLILLLEK